MEVRFDYEECIFSIQQDIAKIPETMNKEKKVILNKAEKLIKATVIKKLSAMESSVSPGTSNYDGTVPYVHMAKDVKSSVKTSKDGTVYVIIRGGKYTSYKWHMLENGTTHTKATHFIEETLTETENEINGYIDEAIGKALADGG